MEQYNLDIRIQSCVVDKDLIKEIEAYLNSRLSKNLKGVLALSDESKIDYKIILKDSLGEEHLSSISDYHKDKFPNDIKEVTLDYKIDYSNVNIRLKFSKEIILSYLSIEIRCGGAKEIALGIKNEIERLLAENKTIHFVFYGKYAWGAWGVLLLSSNALTWSYVKFPYSHQLYLFFLLSVLAYYLIRFISPYTDFETKRKEKRDKFISWFLNGLAGVFVFGVLAYYLRKLMF